MILRCNNILFSNVHFGLDTSGEILSEVCVDEDEHAKSKHFNCVINAFYSIMFKHIYGYTCWSDYCNIISSSCSSYNY